MEKALKKRINKVLLDVESIIQDIQDNNLQNEQFALNFVDTLNKLSITF